MNATSKGNDHMNNSIQAQSSHLPVIAGHEIAIDEHGRFNLNAIHHAAGGEPHKRPSQWARRDEAKELVEEISQSADLHFDPIHSIRGGSYKGTYAHELLAISYAGWISPKFQLQVNQVFLDYRMGRLKKADQQYTLPNPLTPAHQRGIQKAVGRRCFSLPESIRPKAYKRIYSHLKDRFGVAKYDQIPDEQYTEALGAIESYTFSGDFLEAAGMPEPKPVKQIEIGLDAWLDMNRYIALRQIDQNHVMITAKYLVDSEYRSPCLRLIKELEAEGHDLTACRLEIASLRHHLENAVMNLDRIATAAQGVNASPVSFLRG